MDKNSPMGERTRQIMSKRLKALMANHAELTTLKKVAAKSGVGYGTVRRIREAAETDVSIGNVEDVAKVFGLSLLEFISDTDARTENGLTEEARQFAQRFQALPLDKRMEVRTDLTNAELAAKYIASQGRSASQK